VKVFAHLRVKVVVVALVCCGGITAGAVPAHADNDIVSNHLCLDTGFGYYGVTDHVHITDTSGTDHISTFGQASAWTYTGTGSFCDATSATLGCTTSVYEDIYVNGLYLTSTPTYSGSGVHSVSTGNHSYGTSAANFTVLAYVKAGFGNSCTSEADGAESTWSSN
jgi:hypothetical protein